MTNSTNIYRTIGLSEEQVFRRLKKINFAKSIKLDIIRLPNYTIDIVINKNNKLLQKSMNSCFANYIYSHTDKSFENTVADFLFANQKTISVAESCSGGYLAHLLTNISGSSKYFECSVTAYSNTFKMKLLGVKEETLLRYGAVSSKCAREMAKGIRLLTTTDIALSTTGISGPTGATAKKPLGLLYVGYCDGKINRSERIVYESNRVDHKKFSAYFALYLLWQLLIKKT